MVISNVYTICKIIDYRAKNMLESILKNTSEIVSAEELAEILKKEEKIAYIVV